MDTVIIKRNINFFIGCILIHKMPSSKINFF
jgi:hypothetical protein